MYSPIVVLAPISSLAARVSNTVGLQYNKSNYLLMHAMGPNVAGVIGSAVAARERRLLRRQSPPLHMILLCNSLMDMIPLFQKMGGIFHKDKNNYSVLPG